MNTQTHLPMKTGQNTQRRAPKQSGNEKPGWRYAKISEPVQNCVYENGLRLVRPFTYNPKDFIRADDSPAPFSTQFPALWLNGKNSKV